MENLLLCSRALYDKDLLDKTREIEEIRKKNKELRRCLEIIIPGLRQAYGYLGERFPSSSASSTLSNFNEQIDVIAVHLGLSLTSEG